MTFDDDSLSLMLEGGRKIVPLKQLGLDWPPPERINVLGFDFVRSRLSAITDEQRQGMTHVLRGAEYYPERKEQ